MGIWVFFKINPLFFLFVKLCSLTPNIQIQNKRRPVLIISVLDGDDIILCQITSQTVKDSYAIPIEDKDFKSGELK